MKNKIFMTFFYCLTVLIGHSQDTISLSNGTKIYGKFLAMDGHNIKFKVDNMMTSSNWSVATSNSTVSDCEAKDIGQIKFLNNSKYDISIQIHAIGTTPSGNNNNPKILELTAKPQQTVIAYEVSSGVHYVYIYWGYGNPVQVQIPVVKCKTYEYTFQEGN